MRIAVFGTGTVGRTLAAGLAAHGHQVVIGTRSAADTLARTEPEPNGLPPFRTWQGDHPTVSLATFAESARASEVVVNATPGLHSVSVFEQAGASAFDGKVVLDVSNPLDFSKGFPPTLDPVNTDSSAEQLQRAFPTARVVKTLNTVNASVMVQPSTLARGDHTMFVCGDDEDAKGVAHVLLAELGWGDILDLGGLSSARGMEMYLPLWLHLMAALGTVEFNVKVVRPEG